MAQEAAFKRRTGEEIGIITPENPEAQPTTTVDLKDWQDFLHNRQATDTDRTAFVTAWLWDTYEINVHEKPNFFLDLFRIHNHDEQPLHFHAALLDTMIGYTWAELVRDDQQQWRLSVSQNQDMSERHILALSSESIHDDSGELLYLKTLLAAPVMVQAPQATGKYSVLDLNQNPAGLIESTGELPPVNPAALPAYLFTGEIRALPVGQW